MDNLRQNGYLILRNIIPENRIRYAQKYITNKVNYFKIKQFLDIDLLGRVNERLNINLICTKYRISNNNNSTDAGNYHRDLQSYQINEITPVFTCLTYLDIAKMEIIQKSHKNINIPYHKILRFIKKNKLENIIYPGDILIFYATIIHRGIFYNSNNKNRRIIQLFDCIDRKNFRYFQSSILHIPCRPNCSSFIANTLYYINKKKYATNILNSIFVIPVFNGYGIKYQTLNKITNNKNIRYISTESNIDRLSNKIINQDKFLELNYYIINESIIDIDSSRRDRYLWYSIILEPVIISILVIIVIVTIVISIMLLIIKTRKKI